MPHDPAETFVVVSVSRYDIAQNLNEYLEDRGELNPNPLAADDARLTSAICQEYAAKLPVCHGEDLENDDYDEEVATLHSEIAKKLGLI